MRAGVCPRLCAGLVAPGGLDVAEVVAHRLLGGHGVVGGDAVPDAAVHRHHQPAAATIISTKVGGSGTVSFTLAPEPLTVVRPKLVRQTF